MQCLNTGYVDYNSSLIQFVILLLFIPPLLQNKVGYLTGSTTLKVNTIINDSPEELRLFDEETELYFSIKGM